MPSSTDWQDKRSQCTGTSQVTRALRTRANRRGRSAPSVARPRRDGPTSTAPMSARSSGQPTWPRGQRPAPPARLRGYSSPHPKCGGDSAVIAHLGILARAAVAGPRRRATRIRRYDVGHDVWGADTCRRARGSRGGAHDPGRGDLLPGIGRADRRCGQQLPAGQGRGRLAGPDLPAGRGPSPPRGRAWGRQDVAGPQPRVRAGGTLAAHPVHSGPAPRRRDRCLGVPPGQQHVRVPPRPGLLQRRARRRDQPRRPTHPVGAAGGDGGAPGDRRRPAVPRPEAFPGDGHSEPGRDGRHLSAPRGAARPVPYQDRRRVPGPRGGGASPPTRAWRLTRGGRASGQRRRGGGRADRGGADGARGAGDLRLHRDARRAHPHDARAAPGSSPRGALGLLRTSRVRAALDGRTYVVPSDVQALAGPVLGHRMLVAPAFEASGGTAAGAAAQAVAAVAPPPGAGGR